MTRHPMIHLHFPCCMHASLSALIMIITPLPLVLLTHCCHVHVLRGGVHTGNLKDLLAAPQLSGNIPRTVNSGTREVPLFDPAADPKKARDSGKLREAVLNHRPNAILVGTGAPQAKQLKDDLDKIVQYLEGT